jgi:transcriptional regulator with XRE-family HTH domain
MQQSHGPPTMEDTRGNRAALGERIALARVNAGYTNASKFAVSIGVDRNTLYRWESGAVAPDVFNLESVAAATRVSCDWLLRGAIASSAQEVLSRWYETPRGKSASEGARVFLESLPLHGYVPSFGFFDLALMAYENGLSPTEAAQAARETETARNG